MQSSMDNKRQPRILVAEDEEIIAQAICAYLKAQGCEVCQAGDTQQMLMLLAQQEFDIVISDYLMPGGGGKALIEFLLTQPKQPALIMITGLPEEQLLCEIEKLERARCLGKPFQLSSLGEIVEEFLAQGQEQKED